MEWKNCKDELPPIDKYVLAKYNGGNWGDSDDPDGCYHVVVKRVECQVSGNDHVPYKFDSFGPSTYFAQDIDRWAEFEHAPTDQRS